MLLTLLLLLQAPSTKIGWYVWAIAIFFFLFGLGLLIYLMTRPKQEQDDDLENTRGKVLAVDDDRPLPVTMGHEEEAPEPAGPESEIPAAETVIQAETKPLFTDRVKKADRQDTPAEARPEVQEQTTKPLTTAADFAELRDLARSSKPSPDSEKPLIREATTPFVPETAPFVIPPLETPVETTAEFMAEELLTEEDFIPPPVQEEVEEEWDNAPQEVISEAPEPPASAPSPEARSTQILSSQPTPYQTTPQAEEPATGQSGSLADSLMKEAQEEIRAIKTETAPIGSSVEEAELPDLPAAVPIISTAESSTRKLTSDREDASARVTEPASQERLERPEQARPKREPFEPPLIEPLKPKEVANKPSPASRQTPVTPAMPPPSKGTESGATQPLASFSPTITPPRPPVPQPPASETPVAGLQSERPQLRVDEHGVVTGSRRTSTMARPTVQTGSAWASSNLPATADLTPASVAKTPAGRKSGGAVLGLPVEKSNAPLVLGDPVLEEEEIGVSGLSHYGKVKDDSDTGRGGLIALALVVLLLGGGLASYFYVPAVKARANKLLGIGETAPPVEKPKAQVIPSRAMDFNKNIVKARGAVTNISEETLEELAVEVTFYKGEGTPTESKIVSVTPNQLAPQQQGLYEFEYDGSKSTGYGRYRITKLLSKSGEVKFSTPSQQ